MISDQDSGQPVLSLKDVLGLAWHYRYLIAGSLVFCLFLGALYLARTSSVYQNRAALIIRSDERGQMDIAELSTFQDIVERQLRVKQLDRQEDGLIYLFPSACSLP